MNGIIVIFHCESNTGYAIETLERQFFDMALALLGDMKKIHFAYTSLDKGPPKSLPTEFTQYLTLDTNARDATVGANIQNYIQSNQIDVAFGFDQPVSRPMYKYLRAGGIKHFISYWGAPMSSIFGPLKRFLKRIEVQLHRSGPDQYIFESKGMAQTAVQGRGLPAARVHVIYLGVNTLKFKPIEAPSTYAHTEFNIPPHRRIFFYSGHMEHRKGVWNIMHAAKDLAQLRANDDWHILLLGNKNGEEQSLYSELGNGPAKNHVTFGGYREDIARLHQSCYAGIVASTGWDSLTVSAIEMQASGLPLILSNLPGLNEAIEPDTTGLLCPPGDSACIAARMSFLLDNPDIRNTMSGNARRRIETGFTQIQQKQNLTALMTRLTSTSQGR